MELVDKYGNRVEIDEGELTAITQLDELGCDENLDWCRPYISNNGRVAFVSNDGEPIDCATIDGEIIYFGDDTEQRHANLQKFVAAVMGDEYDPEVEYYVDDLTNYNDVFGRCQEVGCHDCPWAKNCEPMQVIMYYMDDDGNKYYDPYQ